jgi:hypothetical protein
MTPIWIFPAYPLLLVGPFAANLIDALPDSAAAARINSIAIALGAICIQGTGFLVSLMIYSAFIYRLMTQKLPRETTRPGMVCIPLPRWKLAAYVYSLFLSDPAGSPWQELSIWETPSFQRLFRTAFQDFQTQLHS